MSGMQKLLVWLTSNLQGQSSGSIGPVYWFLSESKFSQKIMNFNF